jgi:hypothetical protein
MEHEHFAWDEWARADPVIAEELKTYRVADRISHFTILARVRN